MRQVTLDALRGLALFGVLVVNLVLVFRVSIFADLGGIEAVPEGPLDHALLEAIHALFELRAISVFSLLFGIGLEAQRSSAHARGGRFAVRIARRLGMLLAIGAAHLFLVWNGDILTLYALLGLVAAPLLALPARALVGSALGLLVVQLLPLPIPSAFATYDALGAHVAAAHDVYGHGSFAEVLAFRVREVRPIATLLAWIAPRVLALFLLGAAAWREGLFAPRAWPRLRLAVLVLGALALTVALLVPVASLRGLVQQARIVLVPIAQALGFVALVLLAGDRPLGARVLAWFAPIGRMALTSYLTQSFVLTAVFHGWGLGLFDRLAVAPACALAGLLYAAQLVFATWWLRRFRAGPFEWAWRSFTAGARLPLRVDERAR